MRVIDKPAPANGCARFLEVHTHHNDETIAHPQVASLGLLREAIALNLDAAPRHVDVSQVEQVLASLPAVLAVEDLHVWGLSTSRTALTAHVLIDPERLASDALSRDQLLELARERLAELGIRKNTLQLETGEDAPLVGPEAP